MVATPLDDDWNTCIDRLYDSVGREDQLARAPGAFLPHFGASGVTFLTTPDPRTQRSSHVGAIGVSPESLLAYHSHFHAYDEWVRAVWARTIVASHARSGDTVIGCAHVSAAVAVTAGAAVLALGPGYKQLEAEWHIERTDRILALQEARRRSGSVQTPPSKATPPADGASAPKK